MRLTIRFALLPTLALAALPGVARAACVGDCDGNGGVAINELVLGVTIALGSTDVSACPAIDADGHGDATINELIAAVNNALAGCPATPTPLEVTATATATSTTAATGTSTATVSATATRTAPPSATATLTAAPTLSATHTTSPTVQATATETPLATSTASATLAASATATPTGASTATATDTPNNPTGTSTAGITATSTASPSDTPLSSPTATVTGPIDTGTPSGTPTPTATATPGTAAVCGNGFLEAGESCDNCAPDCAIQACTATTPIQTFKVVFEAPVGTLPSVSSVLVGYRSNRVSLPNTGTGARVKLRPMSTSQLVNDLNYALRVVINASAGSSIPSGRLFTIDFDSCSGQAAVTPADFGCQVESCGSSAGPIVGCTCSVTLP